MQKDDEGPGQTVSFRLAPLDISLETTLAKHAQSFFSPMSYPEASELIGQPLREGQAISPFSASDFLTYVERSNLLPDDPARYMHHIRHLLNRMAANNLLTHMGATGKDVMMPERYFSWAGAHISTLQKAGLLWLAGTLRGRFVHQQVSPAIVHIVGSDKYHKDRPRSGSGIVFDRRHVLTCRHVVADMALNRTQTFQGTEFGPDKMKVICHEEDDVAVIKVDGALTPTPGLGFLAPMIAQRVYTFGFPKVPNVRPRVDGTDDAYLVMQSGEVTNEQVIASDRSELFLYSAISRPGDSGGAIVSEDGYVVGMTTNLTQGQYEHEEPFAPHHAGIPAHVLANAVAEMNLGIHLPYETFD